MTTTVGEKCKDSLDKRPLDNYDTYQLINIQIKDNNKIVIKRSKALIKCTIGARPRKA